MTWLLSRRTVPSPRSVAFRAGRPCLKLRLWRSSPTEAPLFIPGDWVQLGIAEPEADQLIGDIGIFLSADGLTGEIGFTLAPAAQGRGIATAAVRQALQVLFGVTAARQVLGITESRNVASVRLLERAGFRYHESRNTVFRGEPCSEEVYVLPRNAG